MSTALAIQNDFDWNNEKHLIDLRRLASQSPLTDIEFNYLVQLGKRTQLNPFNREIWAVKYSPKVAAQIFIGRNGYQISASRHPRYLRHQVTSVYSQDEFKVVNDEIIHSYTHGHRGQLEGAYCKVYLKGVQGYSYVYVTMKEYNLKQSVWNEKPETMIKKVAEVQALRQSFPDFYSGTYSDAEMPQSLELEPALKTIDKNETNTNKLKHILGIEINNETEQSGDNSNTHCDEPIVFEHNPILRNEHNREFFSERAEHYRKDNLQISIEQLEKIELLFLEKGFTQERRKRAMNISKINSLHDLSFDQANKFISKLEKT